MQTETKTQVCENAPPVKRAAIYCRVSTQEQQDGKNIDSQKEELVKYAIDKGYDIVKEYLDDGWSGGTLDRPALDSLRDDAENGMFEFVLVNDVDRISRDNAVSIVKRHLEKHRVQLIFRKLSNGNSPTDNLTLNMLGAFAEFERQIILDRTRRGKKFKVATRKQFIGCRAPYGYTYTTKPKSADGEGKLEINPVESEVVKKMFQWVAYENITAMETVRRLTEMQITTKNGNSKWGKSTVLRILKNESYAGRFCWNKVECIESTKKTGPVQKYQKIHKNGTRQRPKSEWIPLDLPDMRIIDDESFRLVQDRLQSNRIFSKRNSKHEYLLSGGLLKCGKCECTYFGTPMHDRPFYRDSNRQKRFPYKKDCNNPIISASKIEKVVWDTVVKIITCPDFMAKYAKIDLRNLTPPDNDNSEILNNELANIGSEEKRLINAFQKGFLSEEQIKGQLDALKAKRQIISDKLQTPIASKRQLKQDISLNLPNVKNKLATLDFKGKQELVRLLIKGMVLTDNKLVIRGVLPAKIENGLPMQLGYAITKQVSS